MSSNQSPARQLFFTAMLRLIVLASLACGLGLSLGGWALGFAFAGAVCLVAFAYYAWKLAQLYAWLGSDHSAALVPDGAGTWGEVLAELYRLLRTSRVNQRALSEALARFQEAAAALPDGVVMLDNENNIVWCNPTAESHWRIVLNNDRMQTITYFVRYPEFIAFLAARKFKTPLILKLPPLPGSGMRDDITLTVQLVAFGNDQALLLSRDVSERFRLERMRSDFVANVSHELRTPLTVLAGFLETIHKLGPDKAYLIQRSLDHMHDQTERMQRLVDDLLTLSELEDAQNKLSENVIDMHALVEAAIEDAKIMSNDRHRMDASLGQVWLIGNHDEIASLVSNLIGNAVRHAPDGSDITVTLAVNAQTGELEFAVKDNGEGIPAAHLPRLTERFYRVDRGRSRAVGGTGLGLAIVKHVLVRHGGRLNIESEQGSFNHGATFRATLPPERVRLNQPKLEAVTV